MDELLELCLTNAALRNLEGGNFPYWPTRLLATVPGIGSGPQDIWALSPEGKFERLTGPFATFERDVEGLRWEDSREGAFTWWENIPARLAYRAKDSGIEASYNIFEGRVKVSHEVLPQVCVEHIVRKLSLNDLEDWEVRLTQWDFREGGGGRAELTLEGPPYEEGYFGSFNVKLQSIEDYRHPRFEFLYDVERTPGFALVLTIVRQVLRGELWKCQR